MSRPVEDQKPSLRTLMTGLPEIPPFRMLLPRGWEEYAVTNETAEALARRASERMRPLGRPDLDAQLSSQLHRSFKRMQAAGSVIVYLPTNVAEEALVPMSMVASVVRGDNGGSLDPYVANLFRTKGGEFFDTLKSTVRWTKATRGTDDLAGTASLMVNYVIAVPDSGRRRAVLLTSTITHSAHEPLEDEVLQHCVALSDAMVATFAWVAPDSSAEMGTPAH